MSRSGVTTRTTFPPLTRGRLRDLAECRRRFWLQAIARPPWPAAPIPPQVETAILLGQSFHQVMRRHFAGLAPGEFESPELETWWTAWQRHGLSLPPGRYLPETTLTVPFRGERLLARFDLLVFPLDDSHPALIVDWKTERRPRTREELAADLQTDLYPFVLAEGGRALMAQDCSGLPSPDHIEMIYWQANDPRHPVRFPYSKARHAANRVRFGELVEQAREMSPVDEPPVTDDLAICGRCRFLSYCGHPVSPMPDAEPEDDPGPIEELEPDR
jgi:hypothetical protein